MPTESASTSRPAADRKAKAKDQVGPGSEPLSDLVLKAIAEAMPDKPPKESKTEIESRLRIAEEDSAHKRRMTEDDSAHNRRKETIIIGVTAAAAGASCLICVLVALLPGHSDDYRKAALAGLASIVSYGLGFLTGKANAKVP